MPFLNKGEMPSEKGSTSGRKWGFRKFSLTKSGNASGSLSKQSSIECSSPPPAADAEIHSGSPAGEDTTDDNTFTKEGDETLENSDFGDWFPLTGLTSNGKSYQNGNNENGNGFVQSDDEEEIDVTQHQTVLKHLSQQVKVGMDLTRVTLPTFILEKRSLLEMYADFFAHAEFFVLTAEESDAKRRFMLIVKWYLSSFHTGRKGAIAKKPFNPILGEIFRCHWHLPNTKCATSSSSVASANALQPTPSSTAANTCNDQVGPQAQSSQINESVNKNLPGAQRTINNNANITSTSSSATTDAAQKSTTESDISGHNQQSGVNSQLESSLSADDVINRNVNQSGPVPWATENDATFVAEQVSHHPPISAFYAECVSKRVQVNGFIHTKSKFLGLSIGVNMIGEARVKLLDRNEEYVVTFPSGYGRSILTVPWSELGGKCQIQCDSSGYKATVTFHTKSFYSKEKHLVTCECFDTSNTKFCTIKGQWNGKMFVVPPGQKNLANAVEFLDTTRMPMVKKCVRSLQVQELNESRKLWEHVIGALKNKDLDNATMEKKKLEEKQRSEAKRRIQQNVPWKTKEFDEDGRGGYLYRKSLSARLEAEESADPA